MTITSRQKLCSLLIRSSLVVFFAFAEEAPAMSVPVSGDGKRGPEKNLYVSLSGNDQNDGSQMNPVRTFHQAQVRVRELKKINQSDTPINIIIREGVYYLPESLLLTPQDSGSKDAAVTWRSAPGEKVIVRGGRKVTGWTRWKGNIYKVDLKKSGLEGVRFHQLFYKSKETYNREFCQRQILARHPDFDPEHPRTGGFSYTAEQAQKPEEQILYRKGDIPFDDWTNTSQAEIVSIYNRGWNFAITPVRDINQKQRRVTVDAPRRGTGRFIKLNRFFIQNVLDALDRPGEWFLNYETSELYFYPPDDLLHESDVIVPTFDHLIELRGSIPFPHGYLHIHFRKPKNDYIMTAEERVPYDPVRHIRIEGISFECARQDAIRMSGVEECEVVRCTITNVGHVGLNLGAISSVFPEVGNPRVNPESGFEAGPGGGGQVLYFKSPCMRSRVIGCDVWQAGSEGIALYGISNVAENNHVYDIGLYAKDAACICLFGEKNVARRNTLHDCPRCAVFLKGIDNVVELNDVHHTNLETTDMGAIRMVQRNTFLRGNQIRYNRISDTIGYGYDFRVPTHYRSPFYTFGVYLDDFTSGTDVVGNIISRAGRGGVMIHGGGHNTVRGNLIVNAGPYQIELAPIPGRHAANRPGFSVFQSAFEGNRIESNVLVCDQPGNVPYRFSRPDTWGGKKVDFKKNLIYYGDNQPWVGLWDKRATHWREWIEMEMDEKSVIASTKPVVIKNQVWEVKPDSAAWGLGFTDIPVEKIGCYPQPQRASWPVEPNYIRKREEPVLFVDHDYDPGKNGPDTMEYSQTIAQEFIEALRKGE